MLHGHPLFARNLYACHPKVACLLKNLSSGYQKFGRLLDKIRIFCIVSIILYTRFKLFHY